MSWFSSVSSRPHTHFQIKALVDDVHLALTMLRRHVNLLGSPLYRLPPDLFPKVASHLTSETDLVNATHVSYHLRNTLLSHPSLWSHLNFKHEMRARAFLERSGQTPLHIDIRGWDTNRLAGSLAEPCQQSKRIVALKLRDWSIRKVFLSEPLPSLKKLQIFGDPYSNVIWDTLWTPEWGQTEKVTSWSFPSLTSLIVYNLDPTPFYTQHLTCFKFWDVERLTDTSTILSFLDNCPFLEHIDILSDERWDKQDSVVPLPNLRTYTETTFGQVCPVTVLNMLSLPPFCSVTLRSHFGKTAAEAGDTLPGFKNPDYVTKIKRVKLSMAHGAHRNEVTGNEVTGTLEFVNAKGTKTCLERMSFEDEERRPLLQEDERHVHTVTHLNFFRSLDGQSVEILCIGGCTQPDEVTVGFLEEALGFGSVRTLILSHSAVEPCLSALNREPDASDHGRWFSPIHTLVIRPDSSRFNMYPRVLELLLSVAEMRKEAGFPFKSVSLFLQDGLEHEVVWVSQGLKKCVERLEVIVGDDVLDWDVDKYFLDGLDHLQKNWDVQWD